MSEGKKTILYGGLALVAALVAYLSAPVSRTPDVFYDVGEEFFPEFTNPNDALSLEVIDYDEESGTALPFKVEFKGGLWRIPSHMNYPADAKDRLAKTAAGVIGIRKDDFRTDNVADYESCGVIDPLDDTVLTLKGRGKRVTLRGKNEKMLADFIVGRKVEGAEGYRFVRVPGEKRVYAVKMDIDLSTRFSDWIDTDILQVDRNNITRIVLQDYSIDETTRAIEQRDVLDLEKTATGWQADTMATDEEVDMTRMNDLLAALDGLAIVDVRRKPSGLSERLQKTSGSMTISQADALSLQDKGYYFGSNGQLLSNEGELDCETGNGVKYILRFGEVVYANPAETDLESSEEGESPLQENRYLFVTADFRDNLLPEPEKPTDLSFQDKPEADWTSEDHENRRLQEKHAEWEQKVRKGKKAAEALSRRFADWYYVISGASFDKLNLTRQDLIKKKEEEKKAG
jgi:hypothetical protein